MGRKRKRVNYRQLYKDYYGIEFGPEMVVHHIDFDRSNNNISNLLLLPNRLHAKYHFTLQMLVGIDGSGNLNDALKLTGPMVPCHYSQWLHNMADVLNEVLPWIRMKMDFDMMPIEVRRMAYRTDFQITENSVR